MNHNYDNYFAWISRIDDVIQKIEDFYPEIKIDHSNYREIFNNLDQYLDIDDVILNTKNHPFLEYAIRGAKELPDHDFKIIFSDLLTKKDLLNHNLCDSENHCKISKIRQEIFNGISKFFEKSEKDLDLALTEIDSNYKHNLHFVNYEDILDETLEKFIKFNKNSKNSNQLINNFKKTIEKFKNIEHKTHTMAFKLDLAKLISVLDSDNNTLVHDFDQIKNFNLKIDQEYEDFPKFSLFKVDFHDGKPFVPLVCAFSTNYLPKSAEKLYLMLFEHTMKNLNSEYENIDGFVYVGKLIYTETIFEILFEYITSKNFETNDDIKNFFDKTTYQDLYKDFDQFYKAHITKPSFEEFKEDFNKAHFSNNLNEKMHLINPETNEILHHFWFAQKTKEDNNACTWLRSLKNNEKLSQRNDIFDQIKTGFSFID